MRPGRRAPAPSGPPAARAGARRLHPADGRRPAAASPAGAVQTIRHGRTDSGGWMRHDLSAPLLPSTDVPGRSPTPGSGAWPRSREDSRIRCAATTRARRLRRRMISHEGFGPFTRAAAHPPAPSTRGGHPPARAGHRVRAGSAAAQHAAHLATGRHCGPPSGAWSARRPAPGLACPGLPGGGWAGRVRAGATACDRLAMTCRRGSPRGRRLTRPPPEARARRRQPASRHHDAPVRIFDGGSVKAHASRPPPDNVAPV